MYSQNGSWRARPDSRLRGNDVGGVLRGWRGGCCVDDVGGAAWTMWGCCVDGVGALRGWRGVLWVGGTGRGPTRTFPSLVATSRARRRCTGRGPIRTFSVPDTAIPVPHHAVCRPRYRHSHPHHAVCRPRYRHSCPTSRHSHPLPSFPRRRESPVLRLKPYSREYPSPRKVIPPVMFSSGSNPLRLDQ